MGRESGNPSGGRSPLQPPASRQLRQDPRTAQLPVITLTTTDDPREVKRCYELGCGSYVTKPVEYDLDPEDRVVYWNRGAERIYGWSAAEAVGSPVEALHCRGHLAERPEALRAVAERGEWVGELPQVTRDGRRLTVESRWTLVRDEAGRPKGNPMSSPPSWGGRTTGRRSG